MKRFLSLIIMIFILGSAVHAQILSQWRGENRDGIYKESGLMQVWPQQGPKMLWSIEMLGKGFSSPAVTNDGVFITGLIDDAETLFAFDLNGKLLWKQVYGAGWTGSYPGTRTTPTVIGDKLYVFSSQGDVACLSTTDGKVVWSVNALAKFSGVNIQWGVTESLLSDGNNIFVTVGGAQVLMVALNKDTGATVWQTKGNGETTAYSSPILVNHGGKNLILQMIQKSLIAVDAANGKLLWSVPHETDWDVNPNTPIYIDGWVYTNSGYGTGSQMFEISADGSSAKKVWANDTLDSQIGGTVVVDGYIYGSGMKNRGWHCIKWKTGQVMWSDRDQVKKKGPIIAADGKLYIFSETGEMVLAESNSQNFIVKSRFPIDMGDAQYWAHPVIKDGRLYVRHGYALMAYDIKN